MPGRYCASCRATWTFVIVTDRQELDGQIYKHFASAGVVTEGRAQAESVKHLRQLLREDHRYVFTLSHKFRTEPGEAHPVLSERRDIIVITDEAHRSQYDSLALNMRTALPNAAFLAFTGTPLIFGEEKTRQVFGDYVSVYDFRLSVADGATVPLYHENRIPELQLVNDDLNADMERNEMTNNPRVTVDPNICGGRPCIRGMRIRVSDILGMLAAGASEEILGDYPYLEAANIVTALNFAARQTDRPVSLVD